MSLATLQREIKANPAKAGGLGILLVVACYLWGPLIYGFIVPAEDASPAPAAAGTTAPGAVTPATAPVVTTEGSSNVVADVAAFNWQLFSSQMEKDARMLACVELPGNRDPFSSSQMIVKKTILVDDSDGKSLTPSAAGLVLSSTLVSARKKIAEIDGKSYQPGDIVRAARENAGTAFRVREIQARRVVLERDGKLYDLTIPRPLLDSAEKVIERATADVTSGSEPTDRSAATAPDGVASPNDGEERED